MVTQIQGKQLSDAERAAQQKKIEEAYQKRDSIHEADMIKFFLKQFDELPANQKFKPVEDLFGSLKGEVAWRFREKLAREPLPICARCCGSYVYGKWQRRQAGSVPSPQ